MLPRWTSSLETFSSSTPFWSNQFQKRYNNPEIYKQLCLQLISEYPLSEKKLTDSSKTEEVVAAVAVSTKQKTFYMSASRRQFNIYSRVEGYCFSSQTCLLFQRKIIFDIIWFPFIITVDIKPNIIMIIQF